MSCPADRFTGASRFPVPMHLEQRGPNRGDRCAALSKRVAGDLAALVKFQRDRGVVVTLADVASLDGLLGEGAK
jgi:hypothetical protein